METGRTPILWITGPPAAGRSVTAWDVFRRLTATGVRVAYLDIDQVGMLYPAPPDDPEAHRHKAIALRALVPGYRARGARAVIVSGVVDPHIGPRDELAESCDLTLVALAPDATSLRDRLVERGWTPPEVDETVAEADELRRARFLDDVIEASGLSIEQVADRVVDRVALAASTPAPAVPPRPSDATLPVLAITGGRAVGSSTVGYGFAARRWAAGLTTAYVDPAQLSFLGASAALTDQGLADHQLAAMHALLAGTAASLLVVGGRASDPAGWAPSAPRLLVRLRADRATVEDHLRQRAAGGAARLAGDDLLGADPAHLAAVARSSIAHQEHCDEQEPTDERLLDATGRTADEVIDDLERLAAEAGW